MQLGSDALSIPDGLLAHSLLLREKPRQGVASKNPAPHPGIDLSNSTTAIGLRASAALNAVRSRYTGKERDAESGNDYFGARYFASTMGRFLSPDWSAKAEPVPYAKLDDPQSLNLYGYTRNSPLSRTDPDGHCDADGEHHGTAWCFFHALGLNETRKQQIADARFYANEYYDEHGVPKDHRPNLTDDQVLNAFHNGGFAKTNNVLDAAEAVLGFGGGAVTYYRAGDSLIARAKVDVKVDANGMVQPGRGVSINVDPNAVPAKYGAPHEVGSLPEGLEIVQRNSPGHFEIGPSRPMPMSEYQSLLNQVVLTPIK